MAIAEIELTEEEVGRLQEVAQERRLSLPDLLHQEVVARLLARSEPTMAEKRRRALEVSGKYRGAPDLADNHDKYLVEAFEG